LARFASALDAAGLNLRAALPIDTYDAAVPEPWRSAALRPDARRAIVVASGGRALWDALTRAPELGAVADPLDAYTRRVTAAAASELEPGAAVLYAHERRGGLYADFVELGRLAGLGAPSRLHLLLHPIYGPWMSLRAVVLTSLEGQTGAPLAFDPCRDCPAPCTAAASHERARRACLVGPDHRYGEAALAHLRHHAGLS